MVSTLALLSAVLFALAAGVALARFRSHGAAPTGRAEAAPTVTRPHAPSEPDATAAPPAAGSDAVVDVAVANLWIEPARTRPVDAPSLTNPVDIRRWLATMTTEDRLWLVGRLATQALYGDRVKVLTTQGDWAHVVVTGQPSSLHPDGYPGWLPTAQLAPVRAVDVVRSAFVTAPVTALRDGADPERPVMDLVYATRLPVVATDGAWVRVATPSGTSALLATADVQLSDTPADPPRGADLVAAARLFSGLPYLWGGTSGLGFDCSGLTWATYGAHGIVLPRDAADQAAAGRTVDPAQLEAGDLLFYATGEDRASIHHVAMYVGNGRMIQSVATGRTVETVPVDTPAYAREFWGARRYVES